MINPFWPWLPQLWPWLPFAIIVLGLAGQTWLVHRQDRRRQSDATRAGERHEQLLAEIRQSVARSAGDREAADSELWRKELREMNEQLKNFRADLERLATESEAMKGELNRVKQQLSARVETAASYEPEKPGTGERSPETHARSAEAAAGGDAARADETPETPSASELRRDVNAWLSDQPLPDGSEFLSKYTHHACMIDRQTQSVRLSATGMLMLVMKERENFLLPGEDILDQRTLYKKRLEMLSTDVDLCYDLVADGSGRLQIARLPTLVGEKIISKGRLTGLVAS